jgi:hypothetical protein
VYLLLCEQMLMPLVCSDTFILKMYIQYVRADGLHASFLTTRIAVCQQLLPQQPTAIHMTFLHGCTCSAAALLLHSEPAPQVNNYSSTTIVAAPPVIASPIISPIIPVSPFGVSIVPVIPIPLPNPFASPPPPPAPSAESLAVAEATAAANAAAAAASAAAAAAATATAVAVAAK